MWAGPQLGRASEAGSFLDETVFVLLLSRPCYVFEEKCTLQVTQGMGGCYTLYKLLGIELSALEETEARDIQYLSKFIHVGKWQIQALSRLAAGSTPLCHPLQHPGSMSFLFSQGNLLGLTDDSSEIPLATAPLCPEPLLSALPSEHRHYVPPSQLSSGFPFVPHMKSGRQGHLSEDGGPRVSQGLKEEAASTYTREISSDSPPYLLFYA